MKKYLLFAVTALIVTPTVALAQRYLVDLPIDTQGDFNQYINLLYKMSISIAALLAVVKIVIAGAKYMLSDVVTNKSDAKKDIQGALLGLLLILGAVIILNTVNPALTDGGLNITQLKRIATNEDALSPVAAAKQQGDELTAGLPECHKDVSSVSKDGSKKLTTVDVSECPVDQRVAILTTFGTNCQSAGGTGDPNGAGSNKITCSVPLPTGKVFSGYNITDYDEIDQNFVTRVGNFYTLDVTGQCNSDTAKFEGRSQDELARYNATCLEQVAEEFREFCADDNGGNHTKNGGSSKCELPIRTAVVTSLTKEFEQYKNALPAGDFRRKAASPSEDIYADICKIWGGTYRDLEGVADASDVCVDFTP